METVEQIRINFLNIKMLRSVTGSTYEYDEIVANALSLRRCWLLSHLQSFMPYKIRKNYECVGVAA